MAFRGSIGAFSLHRGSGMIVIDGMGGLVGWAVVNGVRVAVYSADRAMLAFEESEGLTWQESEAVLEAAEAGLVEAVEAGDLAAAPVIVWTADQADI